MARTDILFRCSCPDHVWVQYMEPTKQQHIWIWGEKMQSYIVPLCYVVRESAMPDPIIKGDRPYSEFKELN